MLGFFADVFGIATRQERWSGPSHLQQPKRQKSAWEIERDLAEEKAKTLRRSGLL